MSVLHLFFDDLLRLRLGETKFGTHQENQLLDTYLARRKLRCFREIVSRKQQPKIYKFGVKTEKEAKECSLHNGQKFVSQKQD